MNVPGLTLSLLMMSCAVVQNANAQGLISGDILANEINKTVNDVGWSFIQNEYNKVGYQEMRTDGEILVQEISDKISERMKEVNSALTSLKSAVESYKLSSDDVPQDCCIDGMYQPNFRFRTDVSLEMFCYSKPSYVTGNNFKYISNNVMDVMKTNLNKKSLQFQYISLKSGLYFNYPATLLTDCESYDPRFRPFYASTTKSKPRDVVVALEMSASMRGDKFVKAKQATFTVMETLSIHDRFGIVVFNNKAYTKDGCYENQLVPLTQTTKDSLQKFLNSLEGKSSANYTEAVQKAFVYFKTSTDGENRDQILLFVSDGSNDGGDPLEVIRDENQQLNNRVFIHTFGIGTGLTGLDNELLKNMTEQTLNDNNYGYIKRGKFVRVTDLTYLREAMGTFYDDSNIPITDIPTYTMPYKDFFTNESIITACLPFALNGVFEGVVCADVLLSELVAEILYLKQGEFSYAFVMDGEERTLVHPLIPDPRDVNAKEQDIINIYNFETSGDVHEVIWSMKKGFKGFKSLDITVVETRGQKYLDGDTHQIVKAIYHWTPIVASGSNYSVCLVMKLNNTEFSIIDQPQPIAGEFLYHRWDLMGKDWPGPFCRHFKRYATKGNSTVKLTPDAFIEPYQYTGIKETQVTVQQYKEYLSGERSINPGLKVSAIKSIRLTFPLEEFWKTKSQNEAPYVIWRYIATEDGIVRVYPGVRLTDDYDQKLRPWYHRALANKGRNVLLAPYTDRWGAGTVITITRAISIGKKQIIEGALGTDFSIYYFHQKLQDLYPICANKIKYTCIVIDDSGFLVMHPYFIETKSSTTPTDIPQVHITHMEGKISRSLISNGIMYRQPCRDTENKKEQFTYRVNLPISHQGGKVDSTEGYEIRPVTGSNVFLILKTKDRSENNEDRCCSEEKSPLVQYNVEIIHARAFVSKS
uniref:VWFA and cache domain-containing protein 1-like isoform X2 n=1 Tax=Crassostrea virginica TaxID=6565 RepID=A0A8B8AU58_CRAVI|nr:VWFA and cache domain-containing protein 1-like isoform X2 [Crassostrea virginica]